MKKNKPVSISQSSHQVTDAQKQYQAFFDSMAKPGTLSTLPEGPLTLPENANQASMFMAAALFHANVSFCVVTTKSEGLPDYLIATPTALPEKVSCATYTFVPEHTGSTELPEVKTRTLPCPEDHTTWIVEVDEISALKYGQSLELTLNGTGGEVQTKVYVSGLSPAILEHVKERNRAFSPGIDLILTDKENTILYIPSTHCFSWQPRLWMSTE